VEQLSVAQRYGEQWSAGAAVRAEHYAGMSRPAWLHVLAALEIGAGTRLLDVGCGSGEFCALAAERGAATAGIDAAPGMIELARGRLPAADLRIGTLERLPWPAAGFDVVTGFNAFQFAPDLVAALAEAGRVTRPGGHVVVCNWGPVPQCELVGVLRRIEHLRPEPPLVPRRPIGEPGELEELARAAGLRPDSATLVEVSYAAPDRATMLRGLLAAGNVAPAVAHSGAAAVRAALTAAAAPFRRPDGSYLFRNTFRCVISAR
jgi:ubiquinone/menaquinone biosynthesis C-methylase UbiE